MITSEFYDMKIGGIVAALPNMHVDNMEFAEVFSKETVEKIIETTGIKGRYISAEEQTSSDLCCVAAKELLQKKNIDPKSIGVPYLYPISGLYISSSAFVLKRDSAFPLIQGNFMI